VVHTVRPRRWGNLSDRILAYQQVSALTALLPE
jgi:hypothetical protein